MNVRNRVRPVPVFEIDRRDDPTESEPVKNL
jgi:hypothetical protein